jgi:hypothetical protein
MLPRELDGALDHRLRRHVGLGRRFFAPGTSSQASLGSRDLGELFV